MIHNSNNTLKNTMWWRRIVKKKKELPHPCMLWSSPSEKNKLPPTI
jgi:hypothetical protein